MASIQKRGKKHAVVYTYTDQEGQKRQKWETFNTKAEARKRKSAVEAELDNGTFIPPNTTTVEDFLKEFVDLYGEKKWGLSIYASNTALINNYINPLIGNLVVQDINKRTVDKYIQQLQKTAPVNTPYRHAKTEYVTPCTIEKIIKLLRCAFHQAVRWDIIGKNPFEDADLPKREKKVRAIWTADTIRQALDNCQDGMTLYTALVTVAKCAAPMIPFMAEDIYRNLVCSVDPDAPMSVHLCDFPRADSTVTDKELEKNMEAVLKVVVLGRACRNMANIKNRQPIGTMYVKAPFELPAFYTEIIAEELNVKQVEFSDDVSAYTSYSFKPQLRTVGPKYGKHLGQIKQVLSLLDGNAAMEELKSSGMLKLDSIEENIVLLEEDLLITMTQAEGYVTDQDHDITVVLDTNLTAELIEEGFVRELILL